MNQTLMNTGRIWPILALCAFTSSVAHAAVTDVIKFRMGEAGTNSTSGTRPLNTVTSSEVFNTGAAWNSTSNVGPGAANSTDYAVFTGTGSLWGGSSTAIPTDNFGVEFWFRLDTTPVGETEYMFTSNSNNNGSLKFGVDTTNHLTVSYHNLSAFASTPVLTTGQWYHVATIRDAGTSTLYVNGIAQAGTTTAVPTMSASNFRLAETPSGTGNGFIGALDEVRAFSFGSGEGALALASLNTAAIPEPSTYGLLGAGALAGVALIRRRRRA